MECSSCNLLILSGDVYLCHCRVVCSGCISSLGVAPTIDCDQCGAPLDNSLGFNNFYKRLLALLDLPCRNEAMGCAHIVKAGDLHEDTCLFEPVKCIVCEQDVVKILLVTHYQSEHPGHYLTEKNPSVQISSFTLDPMTENHQIYCFLSRGEPVKITLNKLISDEKFAKFVIEGENEIGVKTSFRFAFAVLDMYKYQCGIKLKENCQEVLKVPHETIKHWLNGYSNLRINVSRKETKVAKLDGSKTTDK